MALLNIWGRSHTVQKRHGGRSMLFFTTTVSPRLTNPWLIHTGCPLVISGWIQTTFGGNPLMGQVKNPGSTLTWSFQKRRVHLLPKESGSFLRLSGSGVLLQTKLLLGKAGVELSTRNKQMWPWVKIQIVFPGNIPIPTKLDSNGWCPHPKMVPLLLTHSHVDH